GGQGPTARVGARTPAHRPGPDPALSAPGSPRPPVVVMPDTGLGTHPWFTGDPDVVLARELAGLPLTTPPGPDPEVDGVGADLLGRLGPQAGHGTFVAGVVRQTA